MLKQLNLKYRNKFQIVLKQASYKSKKKSTTSHFPSLNNLILAQTRSKDNNSFPLYK